MSEPTRNFSYQNLTLDPNFGGLKTLNMNEKYHFEDLTLRLLDKIIYLVLAKLRYIQKVVSPQDIQETLIAK